MTRRILTALATILTLGLFVALYVLSDIKLQKHHQAVLKLFIEAKRVEATLENEALKARLLVTSNYDPIVDIEKEGTRVCSEFKSMDYGLYHKISREMDRSIDEYCFELEQKMSNAEIFKSRNAVLRNSLFYLQHLASAGRMTELKWKSPREEQLAGQVIDNTLAFVLLSSADAEDSLELLRKRLDEYSTRNAISEDLVEMTAHADVIFHAKRDVDALIHDIANNRSDLILAKVRQVYFEEYTSSEVDANIFRVALLTLCTLFLGLVVYSSILVWRNGQRLSSANENLERKVEERTLELKASKQLILDQQQSLVVSAKTAALGEMAGQIAHEINTPLGAITLAAQSLNRKAKAGTIVPTDVSSKMEFILQVTGKLARIISSMRKLGGHGASEEISDVVIREMVDDTLLLCEGRFKKAGIDFVLRNHLPKEARLQCRPSEITQVLVNLLNNAHDATKESKVKWVHLDVSKQGDLIKFSVMDSGPGITLENRTKLFKPNFTTKSLDSGTGFGLSICQKLIERHGGKINLDPAAKNTTFVFELPADQAETIASAVAG